jgi:GAF domain-containing protein
MESETRERRLTATFVAIADTLVAEYDVVDMLQTLVDSCADLLDASAAGILLVDGGSELSVVASTSEQSRLVDLLQVQSGRGPSLECFTTGKVVRIEDIETTDGKWPAFREAALGEGFRALHVIPLRLRNTVLGALNLFRTEPGYLKDDDATVGQALADIATISILHEQALRESDIAQAQLQHALNSRVRIEQAKGVIAQLHGVDMDESFRLLRQHARNNGLPLRDVAQRVIERTLSI